MQQKFFRNEMVTVYKLIEGEYYGFRKFIYQKTK